MNTMTAAALGLTLALLFAVGTVAADPQQESSRSTQDSECPPVWFDASAQPHVDADCVNGPVSDNRP